MKAMRGRTIASVVVHPLRVEDVVHGHHVVVLAQRTTPYSPKFLHVSAHAKQKPEVHAERPNVSAGFT